MKAIELMIGNEIMDSEGNVVEVFSLGKDTINNRPETDFSPLDLTLEYLKQQGGVFDSYSEKERYTSLWTITIDEHIELLEEVPDEEYAVVRRGETKTLNYVHELQILRFVERKAYVPEIVNILKKYK